MPMIQTDSQHYTDIADAIRDMSGSSEVFYPADMAGGVRSIPQTIAIAPIIYSLEEREVGVWTDGKPLYQRTWVFNNTPLVSNAPNFFVLSVNNIEHVYNIQAFIANSSKDGYRPINDNPSGISSASELTKLTYALIAKQENNIKLAVYTDGSWNSPNLYITIQYTKTTDTPGSGTWTPSGVPAHHYSTEEQVIGTWIDGKTLYEKTIDVGYLLNRGSKDTQISGSITIISMDGIMIRDDGVTAQVQYVSTDSSDPVGIFYNSNILRVVTTSDRSSYHCYVIIKYTKTTD